LHIRDSAGVPVYDESLQVMIGPSDSLDVQFTPCWVTYAGTFTTRCSTFLLGDQNGLNDVKRGSFVVEARPGVEESPRSTASSSQPSATVVRGVLTLSSAANLKPQASSLLDAAGRKVMALKHGPNDVRRLSPGVYFIRRSDEKRLQRIVVVR
jgi:hypothetical protein